jgi:hypothetical protein
VFPTVFDCGVSHFRPQSVFLTFAGNAATFTGAALACLGSGEKYGAF